MATKPPLSNFVDATFFVQIEPELRGDWTKKESVRGAKAVRMTQTRSRQPKPGTVEVALTVRLPKQVFMALAPEAIIVIPEDMVIIHPIEVEATDPETGDED